MPVVYGQNLMSALRGRDYHLQGTVVMKAYTTHKEKSEVFVSYQSRDQSTALELAADLDRYGRHVFIDVHDGTLGPLVTHIDDALVMAINKADTMVIVVSDKTQDSWWVPWEIGVSTPFRKPRAMYKPLVAGPLPAYLDKLPRLWNPASTNKWVVENREV